MITVLIALGAGVGGILIGAGWVIWRVSRRHTRAHRVEPVRLPAHAQVGDTVITMSSRNRVKDSGAVQKRATPTVLPRMGSRDASADYDPPDVREDRGW